MKLGKLFIVATPIGNYLDITLRALEILKSVDCVICEEYKQGSKLLKKINIENELILLNEHNEKEQAPLIIEDLLSGKDFALISDCGTPVFADPGYHLVNQYVTMGGDPIPVPGASSLMAALSVLDIKLEKFTFIGFLPRDKTSRNNEIKILKRIKMPIVLMDTPYRLNKLLSELRDELGNTAEVTLAVDLTLPQEKIYRGRLGDVLRDIGNRKGEFILIIH